MSNQTKPRPNRKSTAKLDVETLYHRFLKVFYAKPNHEKARELAVQLEQSLANSPEYAGSIRSEEIRSLIAELNENFAEAARCREAEIRKILALHSLSVNTPSWDVVAKQYDFSDVSDRLDLLAMLYDQLGDTERAIATLQESKSYCASHTIPFDGQDMLDELEASRR